jgi:hypothetical protein
MRTGLGFKEEKRRGSKKERNEVYGSRKRKEREKNRREKV